jgi:hypothetical protein
MRMALEGVGAWLSALDAALTEELAGGMERAAEMVAAEARANHDYENRTGTLEERTMVGGPVVTTANHVVAKVVADTRYGSYIEDGTETIRPRRFLARAAERRTSGMIAELDVALLRAGEKASQ